MVSMGALKMTDTKTTDQIAGREIAGRENEGQIKMQDMKLQANAEREPITGSEAEAPGAEPLVWGHSSLWLKPFSFWMPNGSSKLNSPRAPYFANRRVKTFQT